MGDTCNQANRVKELLARSIEDEFEAKDPEWESLDGNAREERCRVYQMDCWNHLRNVWFGNASKAMVAVVRDELRDHLSNFDGHSRVSPDISQLLRGVFKEFHQGGEYAKGKAATTTPGWRTTTPTSSTSMRLAPRAGARTSIMRRPWLFISTAPTTSSF